MSTASTLSQYKAFIENLRKRHAELTAELVELESVPGLLEGHEVGNPKKRGPKPGRKADTTAPKVARGKRTSITIDQVVAAIRSGKTNNKSIAASLGCSAATVKNTVTKEGKKAGIKSSGDRRSFAYSVSE